MYSSSEPFLATKHELNTIYDINDLFDFLEVLDVRDEMQDIQDIEMKAERDRIKQQQDMHAAKGRP